MDIISLPSADLSGGLQLDTELSTCSSSRCNGLSTDWHPNHPYNSPTKDHLWDELQEDVANNLLLREIDFLNLPLFDPDLTSKQSNVYSSSHDSSLCSVSSQCTKELVQSDSSSMSLEDTIDSFDEMPLCDSLPDNFDLLSYAESLDDTLLLHKSSKDWASPDPSEITDSKLLPPDSLTELGDTLTQMESHLTVNDLQSQPKLSSCNTMNINLPALCQEKQSRRDADEPKRPKNGFIRYSIKHRTELSRRYPYKDNRTISKLLGIRWKKLTAEEKRPYEEAFCDDIHKIRSQNPAWRYAPAKRSAEELVDPMASRLRPRDKIRSKIVQMEDSDSDFSQSSPRAGSYDTCGSTIQHKESPWTQYDTHKLPGLVDMARLSPAWHCYMAPDVVNSQGIPVASSPQSQPQGQHSCPSLAPAMLQATHTVHQQSLNTSQHVNISHQAPLLLLYSSHPISICTSSSNNMIHTIIINHATAM